MKGYTKKELAWISRLQKVLDSQPDSLQVFDNESGISIYKGDLPETSSGGIGSKIEHEMVSPKRGHWEGGAW